MLKHLLEMRFTRQHRKFLRAIHAADVPGKQNEQLVQKWEFSFVNVCLENI